ncbi:hypothetical protein NPN18_23530, partial [Vibrio parahaemolyticus]|nr:hypothetical protein [Vibrio parahaemolyticus]
MAAGRTVGALGLEKVADSEDIDGDLGAGTEKVGKKTISTDSGTEQAAEAGFGGGVLDLGRLLVAAVDGLVGTAPVASLAESHLVQILSTMVAGGSSS